SAEHAGGKGRRRQVLPAHAELERDGHVPRARRGPREFPAGGRIRDRAEGAATVHGAKTSSAVPRDLARPRETEDSRTAMVKSLDRSISNGRKRDRPSRVASARRARSAGSRADSVFLARRRGRHEWPRGRKRTIPDLRDRSVVLRPRGKRPPDPDGGHRDRGPWPSASERS